jgi:hypothetical protein
MMNTIVYLVLAVLALAGLGLFVSIKRGIGRRQSKLLLDQHRLLFMEERKSLEELFFQQASSSGKPRHLDWVRCDFEPGVVFARDRQNHQLRALVAVTIQFEATPGGDMEDVEAVGNLRAGTAVFLHDGSQWTTAGRTIYNLDPAEALEHFSQELEPIDEAS